MKAYLFFMSEDPGGPPYELETVDALYLDRQKALDYWIYDLVCYGTLGEPDPETVVEAKELFEQAEEDGEILEHEGACMQVVDVNE